MLSSYHSTPRDSRNQVHDKPCLRPIRHSLYIDYQKRNMTKIAKHSRLLAPHCACSSSSTMSLRYHCPNSHQHQVMYNANYPSTSNPVCNARVSRVNSLVKHATLVTLILPPTSYTIPSSKARRALDRLHPDTPPLSRLSACPTHQFSPAAR